MKKPTKKPKKKLRLFSFFLTKRVDNYIILMYNIIIVRVKKKQKTKETVNMEKEMKMYKKGLESDLDFYKSQLNKDLDREKEIKVLNQIKQIKAELKDFE
jgi:hypothetical protein